MAFWGVEVKAGNPFTHTFDASKGRLHVSMASLGSGDAFERSSVLQCNVGNTRPVVLCSLTPSAAESLQLNLEFEEAGDVVFSVIGRRSIHLSGYYLSASRNHHMSEDSESYGEDIANSDSNSGECFDDDDYDSTDSFIQDGTPELLSPSSSSSLGEYRFKKRKPAKRTSRRRRLVKAHQPSESDDDKGYSLPKQNTELVSEDEDKKRKPGKGRRRLVKAHQLSESDDKGCFLPKLNSELVSEDEDKCPISALFSAKKDRGENEDKGIDLTPKRQSDVELASAVDRENVEIPKKRIERDGTGRVKIDGKNQNEVNVDSDINAENGNILKDFGLVDASGERLKKRKKNRKEEMNKEKTSDIQISQLEVQGMQEDLNEKRESKEKKVSKKKKISEKVVDNGEAMIKENPTSSFTDAMSNPTAWVQTSENGLVIEVLESGKPDAKVARSGDKVSIRYVSKLKKTGEVTDSNIGQDPHKFRLGSKKIIEGLEIGLEGMRVCEKRRITVPPTMAYGSEGNGKNVPPDSWLVFEVELVKVR